ncbi:enoyl-CoA hydratase/isomerase family protein [Streptomyces ipomoeae]|uniref:enoyl-CoA hydratase/isomerase family protein n=1 Tax=Streptomyces ipomoeae TaxID=103232 RepID=UPI00114647F4|nr:enoyl-CoA hydratase/isomerase family protein [Streptomyces ipomoeae]MDX2937772.1 enoyl-CoA hydratase/isomerase family protein [Streptomyces ipomoeae]TQE17223.1 enoyl-CoA hydratase/isomerase family protein [Streptomyces ipomoeae]
MSPSTDGPVVYQPGEVATLTVDNPPANTLTTAVLTAIDAALDRITADPATRCLVLAARGRQFTAGGDAHELLAAVGDAHEVEKHVALTGRVFARLRELRVPVVAAVDGAAVGGGLELLLCCDVIVASSAARFGLPEVKLGLIPGAGGTQLLPRRIGPVAAAELLLTGRLLDAAQAHRLRLVTEVVDPPALPRAVEIAERIAGMAPGAVAAIKQAIVAAGRLLLDEGILTERRLFVELMERPETAEGLRRFLGADPNTA